MKNKKKKKSTKVNEKNYNQVIIKKAITRVNKEEFKRRSIPMEIELTEIEHNVLLALAEGRSCHEIQAGIKLSNPKDSYSNVTKRLKRKLNAFTLAHVVCKGVFLGLI